MSLITVCGILFPYTLFMVLFTCIKSPVPKLLSFPVLVLFKQGLFIHFKCRVRDKERQKVGGGG